MAESLKQTLNRSDLNTLADALRKLGFGDILRALPVQIRRSGTTPSVAYSGASTIDAQAADAPAQAEGDVVELVVAYARAGAGTPGLLAATTGVPAAGEVSVAPNGQILTNATDAWTDVDVFYLPTAGEVVEVTASVSGDSLALPSSVLDRGAVLLLSAESLAGTLTGVLTPVAAGSAPATTQAALSAAKDTVEFNNADAVTSARVSLLVGSAVDVNAELEADSTFV